MGLRTRTLGRTGERVSQIGIGTMAMGGKAYGPVEEGQVIEGLKEALSQGCNFFDTADCYAHGHSEVLLGKAVRQVRNQVLIATKAGSDFYHGPEQFNFQPSYLRFALHQSLRRLNTDYIDIYQLHNPPVEVLFQQDVIDELRAMKFLGKVRWLGVSVQGIHDGLHVINAGWPDIIQLPYNLLSPQGLTIINACAERQIGVIVREALANGMLTDGFGPHKRYPEGDIRTFWPHEMIHYFAERVDALRSFVRPNESLAQLAIRFVLESPAVSTVICGCKHKAQVQEALGATHHYPVKVNRAGNDATTATTTPLS